MIPRRVHYAYLFSGNEFLHTQPLPAMCAQLGPRTGSQVDLVSTSVAAEVTCQLCLRKMRARGIVTGAYEELTETNEGMSEGPP